MQLATVEVDFEIYKLIELERTSFDEAPYKALRRLLKLPEEGSETVKPQNKKSWREGLVEIPHGSKARMLYLGQVFSGEFKNGELFVNGAPFSSLSPAAMAVARTRKGKIPSLNGWNYWEAQFPGETKWRSLKEMRQAALDKLDLKI